MKLTRDHYTIGLDAHTDLFRAGLDASDDAVADFVERYVEAAEKLSREKGVAIDVVTGISYDGPAEDYDTDDEAIELWQAIHDRASTVEAL